MFLFLRDLTVRRTPLLSAALLFAIPAAILFGGVVYAFPKGKPPIEQGTYPTNPAATVEYFNNLPPCPPMQGKQSSLPPPAMPDLKNLSNIAECKAVGTKAPSRVQPFAAANREATVTGGPGGYTEDNRAVAVANDHVLTESLGGAGIYDGGTYVASINSRGQPDNYNTHITVQSNVATSCDEYPGTSWDELGWSYNWYDYGYRIYSFVPRLDCSNQGFIYNVHWPVPGETLYLEIMWSGSGDTWYNMWWNGSSWMIMCTSGGICGLDLGFGPNETTTYFYGFETNPGLDRTEYPVIHDYARLQYVMTHHLNSWSFQPWTAANRPNTFWYGGPKIDLPGGDVFCATVPYAKWYNMTVVMKPPSTWPCATN